MIKLFLNLEQTKLRFFCTKLLTKYDFAVYSTVSTISQYQLPGYDQIFYSKPQLINWAIENNKIVKGESYE